MLEPGQMVERYTVEDYLGHGGVAVVYRVRHNQLGTVHALKVLTVPRPAVRERLLQEGRAQARLRHPNVVAVTDVLEVDGSPALLMEYVEGPTLEEWLSRFRPSIEEVYAIARGLCSGVAEAHALDLVHRDLKPANVLLASGRGVLVPKVTDFGIAKLLSASDVSVTATNMAMGTPHYMSPEQIRDAQGADRRSDLFSIGAILYELATGQKAFPGNDVLTVLNAVAEARYVPPEELAPDLPDGLLVAIEGCLQVDRERRLTSPAEVLQRLGETWPDAAVVQGVELAAAEYETEEVRTEREAWLDSARRPLDGLDDERTRGGRSPAGGGQARGDLSGVPDAEKATPRRQVALPEAATTHEGRLRAVAFDPPPANSDTPFVPVSPDAATQPRPQPRRDAPGDPERTAPLPPRRRPPHVVVVRLLISAVIGVLIGLFAVVAIVVITGWPGRAPAPEEAPEVRLEDVVRPPSD